MGSIEDISQLCRLCLVKDQVNIPIFDETSDIGQTFLKIKSCLPVEVSRDDNLPKKICDGCSYKLDMLYVFRNTSVDSEKQLNLWLRQAGLSSCSLSQLAVKDPLANAKPEIMVKQETFDATDRIEGENTEMGAEAHTYIMQQQTLPYQQDFEYGEPSGSTAGIMTEEPPPKRAKRAAALKKVPLETEEDDDLDAAMQITKAEEEDSDEVDQPDYVEAPSTSADDQPGPSGVGKGTIEAPFKKEGNLEYKCTVCSSTYKELDDLLFHRKSFSECNDAPLMLPIKEECTENGKRTKKRSWVCDLCPRAFKFEHHLTNHRQRHFRPQQTSFTCDKCPRTYKFKSQLNLHRVRHFEPKIKCTECDKHFYRRYEMKDHVTVHHKNVLHCCNICSYAGPTKTSLRLHMIARHSKEYPHKCDICDKGFVKKSHLDTHRMSVHEDQRFVCEYCHKVFKYQRGLSRHLQLHAPDAAQRGFVCEICSKIIRNPKDFERHMKAHRGERDKLSCDICGKVLSATSLSRHKQRHFGLKNNFVCDVCGKALSSEVSLKFHMRTHTKDKPYKCTICGKRHTTNSGLKVHIRTHTGERPFKCEVCDGEFVSSSRLKQHKCKNRDT